MVAASSASRPKSAKRLKNQTQTTKSHRFETFSQRVAKLKIDPIHRVRRPSFGEDGDETSSYFRSAFDHWAELNLSDNFAQFCRRVSPLSESLAQILYHEERIMELLVEFIGKRDQNSLEPLLSLLAQFARDLGAKFEKHFASAVTLVASVAATHPEVEAVEWSFSCLAWIFKFLSRLLVPDLRQLLGIMSPYLGKERQKPFVARFAAESMSFLIRKAGLVYYKNKAPLERVVTFLFNDLRETAAQSKKVEAYMEGLMVMFSDAMKGVKDGLHSNGLDILSCVLENAPVNDELQSALALQVVSGVIINVLHHTTADTFEPVLQTISSYVESHLRDGKHHAELCCRLIFLCVSTRKGSRVKDWKPVHQTLLLLLQSASASIQLFEGGMPQVLTAVAYALQTSPMDEMLPSMRPLMDAVMSDAFQPYFLSFCATFSEWGSERFHIIVLPHFQRFINSSWDEGKFDVCLALLRLHERGCVTSDISKPGYITCPESWKSSIKDIFSRSNFSETQLTLLNAYSKFSAIISITGEPSLVPDLTQCLHQQLLRTLESIQNESSASTNFFLGKGFKAYVQLAVEAGNIDPHLWRRLNRVTAEYSRFPAFLEAVLAYMSACPKAIGLNDMALVHFAQALIANLAGPSHNLRLLSLKILRELMVQTADDPSAVGLAMEIEESALTLQSARVLSMQLRKLAMLYPQVASRRWMATLIPNFCFGLFSKRLTPLWDDSAAALKSISEHPVAEQIVSDIAIQWLQERGSVMSESIDEENESYASGDFECYNMAKTEKLLSTNFENSEKPEEALMRIFEQDHRYSSTIPAFPRTHALRVLNAIPNIAEKHSRQVVPLFLSWALRDEDDRVSPVGESESSTTGEPYIPWGFKDRLSFLALFAQFVNPRVLYKATEVHSALFGLLCHGNSEIQRSALKALFTWKSPSILPYQENLLNILDESRFRDELSTFVNVGSDDSFIEEGHKGELLPVLLRLLYGRMISKASVSSGQAAQAARRKTILRTLSHLSEKDFEIFLQIAYGPLGQARVVQHGQADEQVLEQELASPKRQMGLLRMIETMFESLRGRMTPYTETSMDVILYCLVRACRELHNSQSMDSAETEEGRRLTVLRNIRHTSIRCLDLVFSISLDRDWSQYVRVIFDEVVSPRLENFAVETAQGISGFLRLFHTWATTPRSAFYLVQYDKTVMSRTADVLGVDSARDEVKIFVMDEILVPVVELASGKKLQETEEMSDFSADEIRTEVLSPYIEHTLSHLGRLLKRAPSKPLLISGVQTLSLLAPCVESSQETSSLISTTTYLLRQPPDRVSPKTKSGLLRILEHFLPLYRRHEDTALSQQVFEAISSMFDYFKDNDNREVLSRVFTAFANHDSELPEVAVLCADLNAISTKRLEVNYDRRLQAFRRVNEGAWETMSAKQCRPLLYNMLYHIKDEEELAIRSSASFGLKRFIERAVASKNNRSDEFDLLVDSILFPALQYGIRQKSELIRAEFVSSLGYFVKLNPDKPAVQDMHVLLVGDDEEASFFNNVLHIQQHRRLRALRRLAAEATSGRLQASNISTIFVPLNEHFIFDQEVDEGAHNLTAEAVATVGVLGEWLDWNQFRANFRRYRGYMQSKPELEKNVLRLLGRMSDALTNAVNQMKAEDNDEDMDGVESSTSRKCALAKSIPSTAKVATELTTNFTPFLTDFIHHKEESQMSLRLPAAVTTIKLLKLLPEEDMAMRLPPVLLDVCSILKSKAQDSRDVARKTLNEIAMLLGPVYFGYILKELRNTLTKGYQLHVLSFTVHSMLVATTDHFKQGDLDYCLGDLAAVVMDDTFGTVGQEKEAEEYISKMKEVKSSKSYDSMELLAKNSTIKNLARLIRPLQGLLREKLNSNIVRKIDELLRRIGVGILRNQGAESRDLLMFCYEIIKESYQEPAQSENRAPETTSEKYFLVNPRAKRGEMRGSTSSHVYKLTRFALDILRSVFNKYDSLLTANNLAGFIPIIGDALVQAHEEVKVSALRLLSTIIKLPLPEIDENSHVYFTEAVKMIKESPSTNTEAAQASLKLISAALRERKSTNLREGHLAYLLQRLTSDIEKPDRQGVTFNFIRAVMSRKLVVPEIYELVDSIATMMVTNQTRSARDLARGTFIHFLVEYPQAKNRWTKQLGFLAKNLEYKHPEGRQSVMEAVHLLLSKTGPELAQDIVGTFFLPLVIVMSNDDSPECREMAGTLLGELYRRAEREQLRTILNPLRSWLEQEDNMMLCSTGLQAMRIYFDVEETEKIKEARFITENLPNIIWPILKDSHHEDWETLYFALQLFTKLCKAVPSIALNKECIAIWNAIRESLFYPHAWVKTCAANLIGTWLADLARSNAETGYGSIPLAGTGQLALGSDEMVHLIRASVRCLRTPGISEELAMQTVRNIIFLARCCAQNGLEFTHGKTDDSDDSGDEEEDGAGEAVNGVSTHQNRSAIHYIFSQASSILRRETVTTRAESLVPKTASIGLFAALCRHLDADQLLPSLPVILLPLQHLTDSSIPAPRSSDEGFRNSYKGLVSNCHEVLDLIQKKLGTTEYVTQMAQVQDAIKERREGRRAKRRIEAVTEPEKYGREKMKKNERKREKRREKGMEHRGKRRGW